MMKMQIWYKRLVVRDELSVKTGGNSGEDREQSPFKLLSKSFQRPLGRFLKGRCYESKKR